MVYAFDLWSSRPRSRLRLHILLLTLFDIGRILFDSFTRNGVVIFNAISISISEIRHVHLNFSIPFKTISRL